MTTLKGVFIKVGALSLIVVMGLVALLTMGGQEGSARTSLAGTNVAVLSPASQSVVYASVNDPSASGVYRSGDGGRTWQLASRELSKQVNALAVSPADPKVVYAGTSGNSIASGENSLYVSTDSGQRWNKTPLLLPASAEGKVPGVLSLAADPSDASTLYVGTDGQGIYKLTEKGTTIAALGSDVFSGARVDQIAVAPSDSQQLFAVTSKGLFASKDGGTIWSEVQTLPEHTLALAVAPSNSQMLYAGTTSMGAYRSTDGGLTWQAIGEGLGLVPGAALAVDRIEVDPQNPLLVYAVPSYVLGTGSGHPTSLGVYVTYDGGDSWRQLSSSATTGQVNSLVAAPKQGGEVYLGTEQGVFLANQAGAGAVNSQDPLPSSILIDGEGKVALSRVLVILFTLVAACAVLVVNPLKACRSLLGRSGQVCE